MNTDKAIESGRRAFQNGEPISANPLLYTKFSALSGWWESGWQNAKREAEQLTNEEYNQ